MLILLFLGGIERDGSKAIVVLHSVLLIVSSTTSEVEIRRGAG